MQFKLFSSLFLILLLLVGISYSTTPIISCGILVGIGETYIFTQNVSSDNSDDCINIGASNSILDGQGYTFFGNGSNNGIRINGDNITVMNLLLTNSSSGMSNSPTTIGMNISHVQFLNVTAIGLHGPGNHFVWDVNINGSGGIGILIDSSTTNVSIIDALIYQTTNQAAGIDFQPGGGNNSLIKNVGINDRGVGITMTGSQNITILNSQIYESQGIGLQGIYVLNSTDITIANSTIYNNSGYQIWVSNSNSTNISFNTIRLAGTKSIFLNLSNNNTIENNSINTLSSIFLASYSPMRYDDGSGAIDYNASSAIYITDSVTADTITPTYSTAVFPSGTKDFVLILGWLNISGVLPASIDNYTYLFDAFTLNNAGIGGCFNITEAAPGTICRLYMNASFVANGSTNNYIDNLTNRFNTTFNVSPSGTYPPTLNIGPPTYLTSFSLVGSCNNTFINNEFNTSISDNTSLGCTQTVIYNNTLGQIKWYNISNLTTSTRLSLGNTIFLQSNLIGLADSSDLSNLNISAQIELKGLGYGHQPYLLKSGARCDNDISSCLITSYGGGVLYANVSSFSNYSTQASPSVILQVNTTSAFCTSGANYSTIQAAINAASGGDVIDVCYDGGAVHNQSATVEVNKSVNIYGIPGHNGFTASYSPIRYSDGSGNIDYNASSAIYITDGGSADTITTTSGAAILPTGSNSFDLILGWVNDSGVLPTAIDNYTYFLDSGAIPDRSCAGVIAAAPGSICRLYMNASFVANGSTNNYIDNLTNRFNTTFNISPSGTYPPTLNLGPLNNPIVNVTVSGVGIFNVSANSVSISNLTIRNAVNGDNTAAGIFLQANSSTISFNNFTNNTRGISSLNAFSNNIYNNTFYGNYKATLITNSSGNNISSNRVHSNSDHGIFITGSSANNIVDSNIVYNNTNNGFLLNGNTGNNTLVNNVAYNNNIGFAIQISGNNLTNNTAYNNAAGFYADSTNENLTSNNATNNTYQYYFDLSSNITFVGTNYAINTPSGGADIYLLNRSNVTTLVGSIYNNFTTSYGTIFFHNTVNVSIKTMNLSDSGAADTGCNSFSGTCTLVTPSNNVVNITNNTGSATINLGMFYSSSASSSQINIAKYSSGWLNLGQTSINTTAASVLYAGITSFSTYGVVSFVPGSTVTSPPPPSGGGPKNFILSHVIICPANNLEVTTTVSDVLIRVQELTSSSTSSYIGETGRAYTDDNGKAVFALSDNGVYRIDATKPDYSSESEDLSFTACEIPIIEENKTIEDKTEVKKTDDQKKDEKHVEIPVKNETEIKLPAYDLKAEDKGNVGDKITITAHKDGQPYANALIFVFLPNGKALELTTDSRGTFSLPLEFAGKYTLSLLDEAGNTVKSREVQSVLNLPEENKKPVVATIPDILQKSLVLLGIVFLFLLVAYLFIRSRNQGNIGYKKN